MSVIENEVRYILKLDKWLNRQIVRAVKKAERKGNRGLEPTSIIYIPFRIGRHARFGVEHTWSLHRTHEILSEKGIAATITFRDCLFVPFAFSDQLEIKLK